MKKTLYIILSVILVLVFASTGVFALTSGSPLTVTFGDVPYITTFPTDGVVIFNNVSDTSGEYVPLFNDVSVLIVTSGTNNTVTFKQNNNTSTSYTYNNIYNLAIKFRFNGTWLSGYVNQYNNFTQSMNYNINFTISGEASQGDSFTYSFNESYSTTYQLVLPYGNALSITSGADFTITRRAYTIQDATYNYQKYVRASDDFSYRVNGAYQGVVSSSSLTGNFSLGVYNSNNVLDLLIPWQPTNQNILGRATDYNYYAGLASENVSVSAGNAFLIWYPYYANNQDTSKLNEVPMQISLKITYSSPIFFTTYPITGSTSSTGEDTYISNSASSSDSGGSSQSEDGEGNVVVSFDNAPTAGGNHGQAPINGNNTILGVLSNLQNTLLGLFNKAIDGIHNLISMGSSFLQSVQIMFSWLPGELLVIITSGFVILLTIGVLKTLWR